MQFPWGLWNLWRGFPKELKGWALSSIFNSTETEPFLWTQSTFHMDGNRFQNSYNLTWFPPSWISDWIHWIVKSWGCPYNNQPGVQEAQEGGEKSRSLPTAPAQPWRGLEEMEKHPGSAGCWGGPEHSTGRKLWAGKRPREEFLRLLPARHRLSARSLSGNLHPASTSVTFPFPSEPTKAQGARQKEKWTAQHRANLAQAQDEQRTRKVLGSQVPEQKVKVLEHEHDSPDVHLLRDGLVPNHLRGHPCHCPRKGHFGTFITELFRRTKIWNLYCICVCNQNTEGEEKKEEIGILWFFLYHNSHWSKLLFNQHNLLMRPRCSQVQYKRKDFVFSLIKALTLFWVVVFCALMHFLMLGVKNQSQ